MDGNDKYVAPDRRDVVGGMPGCKNGMDVIAVTARIKERATSLEKENAKIKEAKKILAELQAKLDTEKKINSRRRKHLLERIQERNEVELEIFNVQDTIDDHNAKAKTFDRQRAQIEERVENVSKKRRHDAASLYGPNFSRMDLYLKLLEDVVLTKERNKKQRQLRLEHIRNDLKKEKADEETIRKEIESTRKIIRNLQFGNVDEEANPCSILDKDTDHSRNGTISNILCRNKDFKEISDLSKRVQETIEQRSILRKKLNEAQQEYDNSNEEMLKWEEKHVEMAIKKNIADQVRN